MFDQRVTLYVPGTIHGFIPSPQFQAEWVDKALSFLAGQFGGATADAPATGAWISPENGLIKETIVKVYAFTSAQGLTAGILSVLDFAGEMAVAGDQEAVGVEINGALRFVPAVSAGASAA